MYNSKHGYDMDEEAIRKRIDAWNKCQKYGEKITQTLENSSTFFKTEKDYHQFKQKNPNIMGINRARDRMISGLVQFMDGLADLKEISGTWLVDPDYINLLFMTAFAKSHFYEKTLHWAKAEQHFQQQRDTDLPGGYSGNGEEKIVREYDTQWFSLQFLYRQLEFTRFVPNYDIVAGIWALESSECSKLIDQWFYIHKEQIQNKIDLTDFTKGYFFRFNSHMTSEKQAHVLYILNNLFRYSMSKPMGTLEYPPWFRDSTITGNKDGDLPHSKNIIPHKINLLNIERLEKAPIIINEEAGMKSIPEEVENGEDKNLMKTIVQSGGGKTLKEIEDIIDEKEKPREQYKGKWDGEHKIESKEGTVYVCNGKVIKIRDSNKNRIEKIYIDNVKYKIGLILNR